MRKIIIVDDAMEKLLTEVFDVAFRGAGVRVSPLWEQLKAAIREEVDKIEIS